MHYRHEKTWYSSTHEYGQTDDIKLALLHILDLQTRIRSMTSVLSTSKALTFIQSWLLNSSILFWTDTRVQRAASSPNVQQATRLKLTCCSMKYLLNLHKIAGVLFPT